MNQPTYSKVQEGLIFDVGCHQGEDTAYYLARGFRVVAVECAPVQIKIIRSRFEEELADGRLTLIERAIAAKNGPLTFYDNPSKSVWGTADPAWAQRNRNLGTKVEEITVEGIRAEELFQKYGIPFYLKVDIEGFDWMVFRALSGFSALRFYRSGGAFNEGATGRIQCV